MRLLELIDRILYCLCDALAFWKSECLEAEEER
jgi:hypothetical protein